MFLLGAGASVEAGIRASLGLTDAIANFKHDDEPEDLIADKVVRFVLGSRKMQRGVEGLDPLKNDIDVEELFSAATALRDRHQNLIAPFVSLWHDEIRSLDSYSSIETDILTDVLVDPSVNAPIKSRPTGVGISSGLSVEQVIGLIKRFISAYSTHRKSGKIIGVRSRRKADVFEDATDVLLHRLSRLVWIDENEPNDELLKRVRYLQPLFAAAKDQGYLSIATLNYDNTIELAARLLQPKPITCETGVQFWNNNGRLDRAPDGLYLLKLHGSINWHFTRANEQFVRYVVCEDGPWHAVAPKTNARYSKEPGIVFGRGNKLRPDGPFLDLLFEFRNELDRSSKLTVIGYGFADDHINEQIRRWLTSDINRRLIAISPSIDSHCPKALERMKGTAPGRVETMALGAKDAIAKLYP